MTSVKIGIIGGSGLDDPEIFEDSTLCIVDTPFGAPSDALRVGKIHDVPCILLARHGRKHNIPPTEVNYRANIWALKEAGCTHIICSSASGSLKNEIMPGDIVIPDSFIDLTKKRADTFYCGKSPFANQVIHIPMEPAFCEETREMIIKAAANIGIKVIPKGTSVIIEGPRYSTLAESKLYRCWGADLVNMTLSTEAVLARELGLKYACIAMATDYDCWHSTHEKVNAANVVKIFEENVGKVTNIIIEAINLISRKDWTECDEMLQKLLKDSIQSQN